jgi:hypothetical protein
VPPDPNASVIAHHPTDHGSARLIAKCKRRHLRTHSEMKELMALARGPADDLSGSKGLEGLRATGATNVRKRGVLVFEGGHRSPYHPSTPCELARSRPAE